MLDEVLTRVASLPGVMRVALGQRPSDVVLGRDTPISIDEDAHARRSQEVGADHRFAGVFQLLDIGILGGRAFTAIDAGQPAIAVINGRRWRADSGPDSSPLGRRFRVRLSGE